MAKYRALQVEFWQDEFTLTLTPEDKFFYIYLLTNTKSNQLGCYKIAKKMMEFETGYNRETIEKLIERFTSYEKIKYCDETSELFILNWWKYNWSKSPKVEKCILKEFEDVENTDFRNSIYTLLIEYGYSIDRVCIELGEKVKRKKEKVKSNNNIYSRADLPIKEIIDYLNDNAGKNFKTTTRKNQHLIKARFNENFNLDDFKRVIDNKVSQWKNDARMNKYLRPETLFGTKFESYLNENVSVVNGDKYNAPPTDSLAYDDNRMTKEQRLKFVQEKMKRPLPIRKIGD
ncbi:conserved phage C-terminal domain-containing protein [Helcococcus kunzii]|uniref:conserved phage C-terminal domain-containing protein n=1 Tax=Helcococcus kunzii TaxID=40091 RepID=UPI0038AF7BE2